MIKEKDLREEKEEADGEKSGEREYMYDAFISYRHAPLDMYVAETLHKKLENFKIPKIADKEVKERGKRGIKRIFRDRDELPLAGNLSDPITEALASSEYLIVICSPRILESIWCQKEIETFIEMRGIENVFAVLIEGEPEDSFPKQLCAIKKEITQEDGTVKVEEIPLEPLAADVRGKNKAEINKKMKAEILRLVAPMIGCSYDDLKQRHKVQRMKKMLISAAVIGAACFLFGAFSLYQALRIQAQSKEIKAQSEAIQAQSEEIKAQSEEIQAQAQDLLAWQSESLSRTAMELYESGDRMSALLVAMEGLPEDLNNPDRPIVAASEAALAEILQVYGNASEVKPFYALKHDTTLLSMVLSPDRSRLVTQDYLEQLYSWDVETGELLAKIDCEDTPLLFNAENALIYEADSDIYFADSDNFEPYHVIEDVYPVYMKLSPMKDKLLVSNGPGSTMVYDALTGEQIVIYQADALSVVAPEVYFSEDGTKVVFEKSKDENGYTTIAVMDIASGEIEKEYTMYYTQLKDAYYTASGELYVILYEQKSSYFDVVYTLRSYDESGNVRWEEQSTDGMYAPICGYGEEYVVYHTLDSIYIRNRLDGECVFSYDYGVRVIRLSTTEGSPLMEIMLNNGVMNLHAYVNGVDVLYTYMDETSDNVQETLHDKNIFVRRSFNSDTVYILQTAFGSKAVEEEDLFDFTRVDDVGENLVLLTREDMVAVYNTDTKEFLYQYPFNGALSQIRLEYTADKIAIVGDRYIELLDIMTGELIERCEIPYEDYSWVSDSKKIYVFDYVEEECQVYDINDLSIVGNYEDIYCKTAVFSGDGKYLIGQVSSFENDVQLNLETGEVKQLEYISSVVAASPDGEHYLCADINSGKLLHLSYDGSEVLQEMEAQTDFIASIGFSPDGQMFYVYYEDSRLEIYDTASFKMLKEYTEMSSISEWVTVESNGMTLLKNNSLDRQDYMLNQNLEIVYTVNPLIGCTDEGMIYTYETRSVYRIPVYNLEMLVEEALAVLGDRELTPEEREKYNID